MKKTPNIKTFNCKYISDGINEDYKLWTKKLAMIISQLLQEFLFNPLPEQVKPILF